MKAEVQQEQLDSAIIKPVCLYYGKNDCIDFELKEKILYGLCKSKNECTYKSKSNKNDIII